MLVPGFTWFVTSENYVETDRNYQTYLHIQTFLLEPYWLDVILLKICRNVDKKRNAPLRTL